MNKLTIVITLLALTFSFNAFGQHITTIKVIKQSAKNADKGLIKTDTSKTKKADKTGDKVKVQGAISTNDTNKVKLQIPDTSKKNASADTSKKPPITIDCTNLGNITHLTVDKNSDGAYTCTLRDAQENPRSSFTLNGFDPASYVSNIKKSLYDLCSDTTTKAWQDVSTSLCSQLTINSILTASLKVSDDDYIDGKMHVYKYIKAHSESRGNLKVSANASGGNVALSDSITVYYIQIQFQDGFIENIMMLGKLNGVGKTLKFENSAPFLFQLKEHLTCWQIEGCMKKRFTAINYTSM